MYGEGGGELSEEVELYEEKDVRSYRVSGYWG